MTVVLVKCVHCPCASWRRPWAKLRRSVRHFREKHACKGTVLNGLCSIAILTYGLSFSNHSLFSGQPLVVQVVPNTVLTIALSWYMVIILFPCLWLRVSHIYSLQCLPLLVCVGYLFWKRKCCKRCRASACCKRVKRNTRGSAQSEVVYTSNIF